MERPRYAADAPGPLSSSFCQSSHLKTSTAMIRVVGLQRRIEGRKTFTAATLYDTDGEVVATAEHVWITIDPKDFR